MKINGVMLGSENPKILGEFYTKIFGKPTWQHEEWYGFSVSGSSLMIGSHSEVKGKNDTPGRIMIVVETDDVQSEFARIKALGSEVIAEPYQPNKDKNPETWLATFADPDGNYFQLTKPWKD
jgi:predicted enzyme related to lactoylglutathione lyase